MVYVARPVVSREDPVEFRVGDHIARAPDQAEAAELITVALGSNRGLRRSIGFLR